MTFDEVARIEKLINDLEMAAIGYGACHRYEEPRYFERMDGLRKAIREVLDKALETSRQPVPSS
jgi:hypothetical protein